MRVKSETVAWGANDAQKIIRLPNAAMLVRQIVVELSFVVNFAAGVTLYADALARNLTVQLYTTDASSAQLYARGDVWKNFLDAFANGAGSEYTEFGAGAGAQTGTWRFVIPVSDAYSPEPDTTALDWALCASPALNITWGGATGLTATAGAHTTTSGTATCYLEGEPRPTGSPAKQLRFLRVWKQYAPLGPTILPAGSNGTRVAMDNAGTYRRVMRQTRESTSATLAYSNGLQTVQEYEISGTKQGEISFTGLRAVARYERKTAPATGVGLDDFDPSDALFIPALPSLDGATSFNELVTTAAALANGIEFILFTETIVLPG